MNGVLFILLPVTFYLLIGLQQQYQNCVFCALFQAIFCIYSYLVLLKKICCSIQQKNCIFCALFPAVFSIRLQVYIKIWYDFSWNIYPMNFFVLFFQPLFAFIYRSLNVSCKCTEKKLCFVWFFVAISCLLISLLISKSNCVFLICNTIVVLSISFGRVFLRYLD